jgi:hypothetical protein
MIKAIETRYNNHVFRSRTEARWAVFFDHAGIKYEYEKQGFVLDGTPYLPDFWLPEAKMWLEVKGDEILPEERKLCEALAKETGFRCALAKGAPKRDGGIYLYNPERDPDAPDPDEMEYFFCDDRRDEGVYWLSSSFSTFVVIGHDKTTPHERWPLVHTATASGYEAAASARFEHGESGFGARPLAT